MEMEIEMEKVLKQQLVRIPFINSAYARTLVAAKQILSVFKRSTRRTTLR